MKSSLFDCCIIFHHSTDLVYRHQPSSCRALPVLRSIRCRLRAQGGSSLSLPCLLPVAKRPNWKWPGTFSQLFGFEVGWSRLSKEKPWLVIKGYWISIHLTWLAWLLRRWKKRRRRWWAGGKKNRVHAPLWAAAIWSPLRGVLQAFSNFSMLFFFFFFLHQSRQCHQMILLFTLRNHPTTISPI